MAMLEHLHGNRKSMRRRVLSGIGTSVKQAVKRNYTSLLKKHSRTLYKSVTAKVFRSGAAVKISPRAEHDNILYGYALAKGSTIKAKKGDFLTFKVGDKWIKKHQITLKPVDWIEAPAKSYLQGSSYRQRLDELKRIWNFVLDGIMCLMTSGTGKVILRRLKGTLSITDT